MPDDVDDAGVPAAGQHDQPLVPHVQHDRLVVVHQPGRAPTRRPARPGAPAGIPVSNGVVRSTSPVTSSIPSSRNDGCRSSTIVNPAPSIAARLGVGSSNMPAAGRRRPAGGSRSPGAAAPAGCCRPSRLATPSSPITWSKWPWLKTTASNVSGAMPSRSRLPIRPSGVIAGVEEHPPGAAVDDDLDQRGEAVLGAQEVDAAAAERHPVGQHRQRAGGAGQPPAADQPLVREQRVAGVVHERGDA